MQAYTDLDIRENGIGNINRDLLNALLRDRTTKKNIIWATDDYIENGAGYEAGSEILDILITGVRARIIRPRVVKAQMKKRDRTRTRAEVFTPSWVCNAQNNLIDAQWFGVENAFNEATEQGWKTNIEQISFPAKRTKSWKHYVDAKRLEITCGEAPFLVSR